jgi:hypothetical protein
MLCGYAKEAARAEVEVGRHRKPGCFSQRESLDREDFDPALYLTAWILGNVPKL